MTERLGPLCVVVVLVIFVFCFVTIDGKAKTKHSKRSVLYFVLIFLPNGVSTPSIRRCNGVTFVEGCFIDLL